MPLGLAGGSREGRRRGAGSQAGPMLARSQEELESGTEERGGREKDQGGEERRERWRKCAHGGVPTLLLLPVPEPA